MTSLQKITRRIDSYRDAMINMQIKLCALPAIAPSNGGQGEVKKAEFLLNFLKESGFADIQYIKAPDMDSPDGYRPSILAHYPGKKADKTIWVMTHMDVVPPGELAQWRGDPYKAWIEGGKIFGRGVEDNQQDMVASLYAIKAFREEGIKPNFRLAVALVSDEETGNIKGIDYVLRTTEAFSLRDMIIVPDAGNEKGTLIEVAEKSILWLKFKTIGRQAHGSTPTKGINSFKAASYLTVELDKLYQKFGLRDRLFEPPVSTFEPTKKEANVPNVNTIPGEDIFYMDCRLLPQYSIPDVEKEIRKAARKIESRFRVSIEIEKKQAATAAPPTSAKAPVVMALKKAIKEIYGEDGKPRGIGGGTVAAFFRHAGFPAAVWSRVDETAHQPNEYCHIDNMLGDAKVFAHVFLQE